MIRLSPLLNVHRTEEELKARTVRSFPPKTIWPYALPIELTIDLFCVSQEEAENLRSRVSALEKERADLKYVVDRLETKVMFRRGCGMRSFLSFRRLV